MKTRVNNSYNMKLIRKAMIDLDLDNLEELAKYLYMSESALRSRVNGRSTVRRSDIEFMEQRLNIKFNWDDFINVRGNYYKFFEIPRERLYERENENG